MDFPGKGLGPALDGPLAGVVVGVPREAELAGEGRHVEDDAAPAALVLPHDPDGARRHAGRAEEEGLDLPVGFLLGGRLCVPRERVSGVVDDDVETETLPKVLRGYGEGAADRFGRRDVQLELEDVGVAVRQVREVAGVACGGDETVLRLAGDEAGDCTTDSRGASCDCRGKKKIKLEKLGLLIRNHVRNLDTHSSKLHPKAGCKACC